MAKKAQAAMEFLMTYGWAILVVIIAIGALAYFGTMQPEQFLPEKCMLPTSSGLFCSEFTSSSSANTITLRLQNILTKSVDIVGITTDDPSCTLSSCTVDPITADTESDCTLNCDGLAAKQKIKAAITVTYATGGLQKATTGSLSAVVP